MQMDLHHCAVAARRATRKWVELHVELRRIHAMDNGTRGVTADGKEGRIRTRNIHRRDLVGDIFVYIPWLQIIHGHRTDLLIAGENGCGWSDRRGRSMNAYARSDIGALRRTCVAIDIDAGRLRSSKAD